MFLVEEPVIAVAIKGHAKAYPLSILTVHEISNDTLNGEAILLTYCLFCNSGIVYHRAVQINGKSLVLEFKVYGMLRNSDMIMHDRKTESW